MKLGWEKSHVGDSSPEGWSALGARSHSKSGEPEGTVQGWERQRPAAGRAGWKGQSDAGQTLSRRQLPGLDSGTVSPVLWGCGCTCHLSFGARVCTELSKSRARVLWLAQASLVQSPALCTDLAAAASVLLLCWLPPGMLSALINVTV